MSLYDAIYLASKIDEELSPQITESVNYKTWVSKEDERRCIICENNHGKIFYIKEKPLIRPPVHFACRCKLELLGAIAAGTATIKGIDGADWWLNYMNKLSDEYINQTELKALGWRKGKSVSDFSNKLLTKGVYRNLNGHLPQKEGRIWYEADINYKTGRRNSQRILWSNDGLIFVTYDHYLTFYEII
ncbi:MAG: phage head morphogenesis protein [Clostridia bacterium]|nr:phage head morphogenesis protein [Clostridia bacterium]